MHRNSLRYRLVRIAELTGWDLNDPEQRFHLDLACRAWLVQQALEGPPQPAQGDDDYQRKRRREGCRDCWPAGLEPDSAPSPARARSRSRGEPA